MWIPDVATGYQSSTEAGTTDPLLVKSKLETPLILVPEHRGNYIQFSLGIEGFTSKQTDQTADWVGSEARSGL